MARLFFSVLLAGGLLLLPSCDTSDPDPDPGVQLPVANPGEGHAVASGAITTSFSGEAFWTIIGEGTSEATFAVGVFRGDIEDVDFNDFEMVAVLGGPTRLAVGNYSLASTGNLAAFYSSHDRAAFNSTGTLSITTSTSERVAGSLRFTGPAGTETQALGNATVDANFNAFFISEEDLPEGEEDDDNGEPASRLGPALR